MSHEPLPRTLLLTLAVVTACHAGCVTPLKLGIVATELSLLVKADDPDATRTAGRSPAAENVLQSYARAKENLVAQEQRSPAIPSPSNQPPANQTPTVRSIVKRGVIALPTAFTTTQIQPAAPPAGLDNEPPPELLPVNPPRAAFNPSIADAEQPQGGQPSTQQRIKSIREISLDIRPPELFNDQQRPMPAPLDEAATALPLLAQSQPFTRGDLANSGYDWQPAAEGLTFCYQPLYFQEVNVERYGRSFGMFQPAVSVVSFYGRVPLLPYMAFARPARRCTCPPHWTLPGYRIPEWERHEFVPSFAGGSAEVAAIAGLILLIP